MYLSNFSRILTAGRNSTSIQVDDIDLKVCFEISGSKVLFTPAGNLAYLGEFDAVDNLIKLYNPSITWIAACAAVSGKHTGDIERLRVTHNADIHFIAQGAAIACNELYIDYLYIHGASPVNIIHGYGQGGHINEIRQRINFFCNFKSLRNVSYDRQVRQLMGAAMRGLQAGGHNDKIEALLRNIFPGEEND
jgi:hypothetical protein